MLLRRDSGGRSRIRRALLRVTVIGLTAAGVPIVAGLATPQHVHPDKLTYNHLFRHADAMGTEFVVRQAGRADVQAIADIYNQAIRSTTTTFDVDEKTVGDRGRWLEEHGDRYPVVVACDGDRIVGWGSLSPYAERKAWEFTVENSVYIDPDYRGRGLGGLILARLVDLASELGFHAVIAQIVGGNEVSVRLHRRFGFRTVGTLREVGWKFGTWLDILLMQKIL